MKIIFIALIVSPVLAHNGLRNWMDTNINWNGEPESVLAPKLHNQPVKSTPPKMKMLEEKRKIKDLLSVLKEHTCFKTYTTKWIKNCFFPIEIEFRIFNKKNQN